MIRLGVNVDHVATLRQARRGGGPDPVEAALLAGKAGADGITAHLREDRRHIQDTDVFRLRKLVNVPLNLEMAATDEILRIAEKLKSAWACLVPEKRQELTTEGGLDIKGNLRSLKEAVRRLHGAGVNVSMFIEAEPEAVRLSKEIGADAVELHTGAYSEAWQKVHPSPQIDRSGEPRVLRELTGQLNRLKVAASLAKEVGLMVNAGHGLNYENVRSLVECFEFHEFNIGFAIVARAVMVGMEPAVREMKERMSQTICVGS